MENQIELEEIELTKGVYLEISADKTKEIASLKQARDEKIAEINSRIQCLENLRKALKEVENKINIETRALSVNRKEKFSINRELSRQKRYAKRINKIYSKGDKTINPSSFYSKYEKAR